MFFNFKKMKKVLIGYMASGKSAVGRGLTHQLKMNFVDLDDYIESNENQKIATIFKEKGEIYFRQKETYYLEELLDKDESIIISLGGGTPCYGNNMKLILAKSQSIYLRTSISSIYDRLQNEKTKRPLVANIDDDKLKEFIAKHLFERRFYYEQAIKTVATDDKTILEVVNEISEN